MSARPVPSSPRGGGLVPYFPSPPRGGGLGRGGVPPSGRTAGIRVKVQRGDPQGGEAPHWEEFQVAVQPGESVTGALWALNAESGASVAYRVSCHRGICASCIMRINGKQRLGCVTEVSPDMEIGPALGTVIKDLVVEQ